MHYRREGVRNTYLTLLLGPFRVRFEQCLHHRLQCLIRHGVVQRQVTTLRKADAAVGCMWSTYERTCGADRESTEGGATGSTRRPV